MNYRVVVQTHTQVFQQSVYMCSVRQSQERERPICHGLFTEVYKPQKLLCISRKYFHKCEHVMQFVNSLLSPDRGCLEMWNLCVCMYRYDICACKHMCLCVWVEAYIGNGICLGVRGQPQMSLNFLWEGLLIVHCRVWKLSRPWASGDSTSPPPRLPLEHWDADTWAYSYLCGVWRFILSSSHLHSMGFPREAVSPAWP